MNIWEPRSHLWYWSGSFVLHVYWRMQSSGGAKYPWDSEHNSCVTLPNTVAVLVFMVLGQWKYLYGLNLRPVKGMWAYYHMQNSFIEDLHLSVPDEVIARPQHILDSWSLIDPGITWLTSFIKDWWMLLPEGAWPPGPFMQEMVSTNWLLKVLRLHSSQRNGQTMVELSETQWALIRRAHLSWKRWCIAAKRLLMASC